MRTPANDLSSRRQVLASLAGAALPFAARATPRRVAVVGAGMAGIGCAWLLDASHDVVVFESRADIGGHVRTLAIDSGGQSWPVDVGAQYFHPVPYPGYTQLLAELGLYPAGTGGSHAFPVTITVDQAGGARPAYVSPQLPGRAWALLADWNQAGTTAFATALRAARRREQADASWALTLGDWLPTLGLDASQWEGLLLPWVASLYSGDIERARSMSARSAMVFAAGAVPDNPLDPVVYHVVDGGMIEPLRRMVAQLARAQVLTSAPVTSLSPRPGGGWMVGTPGLPPLGFDEVVFAAPGGPTLALLAGVPGTARQQQAVSGIEFDDARLMIHADNAYAVATPALQSFFNARIEGAHCEGSMRLADPLAPPGGPGPALWKSWVTHRDTLPQQVLHDVSYRHLSPTVGSLRAQGRLRRLQGQGGLWFAGGWVEPFDSQETALRSAMSVAAGLGATGARLQALQRR
jgi:predicted NAD/FAD-binding protein